jgi:PD-(D/E)XK nuclease superfamily
MKTLENLLQQTSIIQKKYDDLAEYSGEQYNIFEIVNLRTDEISHSAILTNLLDAKGKHGQKDVFLKLFIEQIKHLLEKSRYSEYINTFNTEKATANKEIHIGGVKYETAEGGRVDIVVSSGNKNLVIENKIFAGDQDQQLLRYDNHYKDDPIIYLTLYGEEPSPASKGNLELDKDFICISYHTDISNWIEKCIKEMANKPIIRETLNQYLFLIKSLTNQSNNNKMSEEILKTLMKDKDSFESAKLITNTVTKMESDLNKKLEDLVTLGNNDKLNIDNIIKSDLPNCYLRMVKKFTYQGVKMIRYDIVLNDNVDKFEVIAIQLEIIDYKIHNNVWANDNNISNHLIKIFGSQIDFNYDYNDTKEDILIKIKQQILMIGNEVKILLEKSSDKS